MVSISPVSFWKRHIESFADVDMPAKKHHKFAKTAAGIGVGIGAIAAGLVVGHRTGVFNKASGKMYDKIFHKVLHGGGDPEAFFKDPKFSGMRKVMSGLSVLENAGSTIDKYTNIAYKAVKNVFVKTLKVPQNIYIKLKK